MPHLLSPDAVLRLNPDVQLAALHDGRLIARHMDGVALFGGITLEDLRHVLTLIDGHRSVGMICDALAHRYEEEDLRHLLTDLLGDILHMSPETRPSTTTTVEDETPQAPVLIVGNGPAAAAVLRTLTDHHIGHPHLLSIQSFASCTSRDFIVQDRTTALHFTKAAHHPATEALMRATVADLEARFRGKALIVCVLEETPYQALFDVQTACLGAEVPGLFVTMDPDGLRLGPTVIPGPSPCIACAQIANVRFLREKTTTLFPLLAHLRTLSLQDDTWQTAATQGIAAEVQALLAPDGTPQLLGQVLRVPKTGNPQRYSITKVTDCLVCGRHTPEPSSTYRTTLTAAATLNQIEALEATPRRAMPGRDQALCQSVCILGGGTAGYLTALALRKAHPYLDVTVLASSRVPTIGVGEATTPLMPQFLHIDLGLDIQDFFEAVQPTLKLGIRFAWGQDDAGTFNYPFGPVHVLDAAVHHGNIRACSLQAMMMNAGALPLWTSPGDFRSHLGTEVAYHLDNQRFVRYLEHQAASAGVAHIDAMIVDVERAADGETVETLIAEDRRRFAFDLYIDCSGFRSMLMEHALGSPFVSYAPSLFADSAVVAAVPRSGPILPYTTAEAMDAGWCWNTPQADADHRGYVFASAFLDPDDAIAEMRHKNPGMGEPRVLRFRSGRHAHFWKGNVVAMGNAYGFVEPLESTALHMLIRQIGLLVRAFPLRLNERSLPVILNRQVNAYWDYLGWFLALHYKFNRLRSTPFWNACRADVDVSRHGELLEAFRERGPLSYDRSLSGAFDYPDPLWGAEGVDLILMGQHVPCTLPRPLRPHSAWIQWHNLCRSAVSTALPQNQVLDLFKAHPALLDRFVDPFRTAGPAFGVR